MKKYLIEYTAGSEFKFNAGSKARDDIQSILKKEDFNIIILNNGSKKIDKLLHMINIKKHLSSIEENSIVLLQFPLCNFPTLKKILAELKRKKCRTICLIHDINSLRFKGESNKDIEKEINILNKFDVIISHNSFMKEWLINNGLIKKCICLNLFDYLINNDVKLERNYEETNKSKKEIVFAGNLSEEKSGFLYNINNEMLKYFDIKLYGANLKEDIINKQIKYLGKCLPDELPLKLTGDYGLIWDGNSTESCVGEIGEYLKFNNPHKLSLYMAAGIPVIVWSKSAISKFVKENNVGLVVNNLNEISEILNKKQEYYDEFRNNSMIISKRVVDGGYTKKALKEAINYLNKK